MKPQPEKWDVKGQERKAWAFKLKNGRHQDIERDGVGRVAECCPYGNPKSNPVSYYMKEPVQILDLWGRDDVGFIATIKYPDDVETLESEVDISIDDFCKIKGRKDWRKTSSSLFMLRSFARTWLPGVRTWPEQLGQMSDTDAIAEGIERDPDNTTRSIWRDYLNGGYDLDPLQSYASLWNSINGKSHPWHPDLWTWAVEWKPPVKN
jgi:hypothetical protein